MFPIFVHTSHKDSGLISEMKALFTQIIKSQNAQNEFYIYGLITRDANFYIHCYSVNYMVHSVLEF